MKAPPHLFTDLAGDDLERASAKGESHVVEVGRRPVTRPGSLRRPTSDRVGRAAAYKNRFTDRPMTSAKSASPATDSIAMRNFALWVSGMASVGLNAVEAQSDVKR